MVVMSMEAYEEKMLMLDVEDHLAQSSEEFRSDREIDGQAVSPKIEGEAWRIRSLPPFILSRTWTPSCHKRLFGLHYT